MRTQELCDNGTDILSSDNGQPQMALKNEFEMVGSFTQTG